MRKILLGILVAALLVLFAAMVISGVSIGNFTIGRSIQEIIAQNDDLDTSIATLSTKIDTNYKTARTDLDTSFTKLQTEKKNYQDMIAFSTPEELMAANQTEEYKLDYLWTNIGRYATNNELIMKADLSYGTSGVSNQYNISITVIGEYLSVSEFVYAIEKDPKLGFRIEEFAIIPYSEQALQATFIMKNVAIDPASLSNSGLVSSGTVTTNTDNQANNVGNTNTQNRAASNNNTNNTVKANNTNNTNNTNTNTSNR